MVFQLLPKLGLGVALEFFFKSLKYIYIIATSMLTWLWGQVSHKYVDMYRMT
jgi:hypothetical protein